MQKLKKTFKMANLRTKILSGFLLIIILSIFVLSSLFYWKTSTLLMDRSTTATSKSLNQASKFLSYKLNEVKDVSSLLYMDNDLLETIDRYNLESETHKKYDLYNHISKRLLNLSTGRNVYSIRLYVDDAGFTSHNGSKVISEEQIKEADWYKEVLQSRGGIVWLPSYSYDYGYPREEQKIISLARALYLDGQDNHVGIVVVDMLESTLFDILKEVDVTSQGKVQLVNKEKYIISSDIKKEVGTFAQGYPIDNILASEESGQLNYNYENTKSMIFFRKLNNVDWFLISIVPLREIVQDTSRIFEFMFIIIVIIAFFSILVAFKISDDVTRRLANLSENMVKVQNGDWNIDMIVDSYDEVGDLQRSFSYMVENMKKLIDEQYQAEIDMKDAEFRVLQNQINPHFLYNILDMINWLAMKHGAEDINYIVSRLARFFRISLNMGENVVKLKYEFEHVQLYMEIQNKRFGDDIHVYTSIDDNILEYYTTKLILQPLVENAILHGIRETEEKAGNLCIIGLKEEDFIQIEIIDDGIGMSEEKIEQILSEDTTIGYGIYNVNQRLKLRYGQEYGLQYESKLGYGTSVIVTLPLLTEKNHKNDKE